VHTKEARLERLDDSVPIDTELAKLLEVSVEQVAEGGGGRGRCHGAAGHRLRALHQCVLLPQGRFAEFLHAKAGTGRPADRTAAYAVYEQVASAPGNVARRPRPSWRWPREQLADLGEVTAAEITAADQRVTDLAGLVEPVDEAVISMRDLREPGPKRNEDAKRAREQLDALGDCAHPQGVPKLAAASPTPTT